MTNFMELMIDKVRRVSTIRSRLFLFVGVFLGLTYLSSLISIYKQHAGFVQERRSQIGYIVNNLLPQIAIRPLRYGRKDEIDSTCKSLISGTHIRDIEVYDAHGALFYKASMEQSEGEVTIITADIVAEEIKSRFLSVAEDSSVTKAQLVKIGHIEATIDEAGLQYAAISSVISSSVPVLIIIIISIPLALFLGVSFTRPLREIVTEVERFERSEKLKSVGEGYIDEYGRLAKVLNRASEEISKKTEDLEHQVEIAIDARKFAEEANTQREQFVYSVTGELKYPLEGVTSGLEMLDHNIFNAIARIEDASDVDLSYKQKMILLGELMEYGNQVARAKENVAMIAVLVNEIFSRFNGVDIVIKSVKRRVNLVNSLGRLMEKHKHDATSKNIQFEYRCSRQDDVWVSTDWLEVAQILNVIVGNAIKYTSEGTISCDAKIVSDTSGVTMYFYVTDSGPGLCGKAKDYVINLLANGQVREGPEAPIQGSGLKVAKRVSDRMDGVLSLRSTSSSGSTFFFECRFDEPNIGSHS